VSDDDAEALALTAEEKRALKRTIDNDRFPLAPRLNVLKAILEKLDPQPPKPERPPLRPTRAPSHGRYRRR
jgi:hypothetical protein